MMYAQVRLSDHTIIGAAGPLPAAISAWSGSDAFLADLTGATDPAFGFDGTGFWPVNVTTPTFDPAQQILTGGVTLGTPDASTLTVPGVSTLRSLTSAEIADQQTDLVAYAAAARYGREIGGITFNGSEIATDRDSQSMINGAYNYSLVKPDTTISYKAESGFVTLNADAIQAIAVAVAVHVQACFAAEANVVTQIQAGQITTTAQIDRVFTAIA